MSLVDRAATAELHAHIRKLRQSHWDWRDRAEAAVHAWVSERLPGPAIHVRILEDLSTGKIRARVRITVRPLFMDMQLSKDTG